MSNKIVKNQSKKKMLRRDESSEQGSATYDALGKMYLANPTRRINQPDVLVGGQDATVKFKNTGHVGGSLQQVNGVQTMVVEKTEAVATVQTTATTFVIASQSFFPGSSSMPWLSTISAAFVEYQVLELEYTFVPAVPTTQAGFFMFAFSGDFQDTLPADQAAFLQSEQALLAPVYAGGAGGRALQRFGFPAGDVVGFSVPRYNYCLGVTNVPQTYRIVSNTTFSGYGGVDKNVYSPGRLMYAVNGVTGATAGNNIVVGQLFVRYKLRLLGAVKSGDNA